MLLAAWGALGVVTRHLPSALSAVLAAIVLIGAAWLFWRAFKSFDPIDTRIAAARLEVAAGLGEMAPLTSVDDKPISGNNALWAWHQTQLARVTDKLTKPVLTPVAPTDWAKLIGLIFAIALCAWQPVWAARALNFDLSPILGDRDLVIDLWAKPPDYTGLPLVRLRRDNPYVSLPSGTKLVGRMDGAHGAPVLRVGSKTVKMSRERGQAWQGELPIAHSNRVSLDRLGTRAKWYITVIEDRAPTLISEEAIKIDSRGRLDVAFRAADDYGVTEAVLRVTALKPAIGFAGNNSFESAIDLGEDVEEDGARRVFIDVSEHVMTGEAVSIEIVVRDAIGQETASKPTRLVLPQVNWKTPLGGALQEQRLLILREARPYRASPPARATLYDPQSGLPIKLDLSEPLNNAPSGIVRAEALLGATLAALRETGLSETGILGLQFARERLVLARSTDDAHGVAGLLWQMAMQAEAANQTPAQQKIAAARQALEQALKDGASEQEIAALNQDLREAIGERLNELAQQSESAGGQGSQGGSGNAVSGGDIDQMLQELERSGASGARQEALEQLDKLSELMENLESGGQGDGQSQQGDQSGSSPIDDAMRAQRDLTDETTGRADQNQSAPAPDLAQKQDDLADRLSPKEADEGEQTQGPQTQARAGRAQAAQSMREAADALRRGDMASAGQAQNRAEQALQQAAQAETANSGSGDQDPLGRTQPRRDDGKATKVPDQVERRRARDVREELRRRQGEAGRENEERDYLDRLLKER